MKKYLFRNLPNLWPTPLAQHDRNSALGSTGHEDSTSFPSAQSRTMLSPCVGQATSISHVSKLCGKGQIPEKCCPEVGSSLFFIKSPFIGQRLYPGRTV